MRVVGLLCVAACTYHTPSATGDDVAGDGVPSDSDLTGPTCVGGNPVQICLVALPSTTLDLGTQTIDTDACPGGAATMSGTQIGLCVLAGTSVAISGNAFRAEGTKPLVIVATGNLTVAAGAYLDVSSFIGALPGAGSNFTECVAGAGAGSDNTGGGGGAGGSFGTRGGAGGHGPDATNGRGGTSGPVDDPTRLRGGCTGAAGGGGQGIGGAGGRSGGALALIAGDTLAIDGTIDASAAGGRGAAAGKNGGGGGGSGGMITLYGKTAINMGVAANVFANGAGGGGGSDNSAAGDGEQSTGPTVMPSGGTSGGGGSTGGGPGAIGTNSGGVGGNATKGAGAGGGGVGVILDVSGQTLAGGVFSPQPQ